MLTVMSLHTYSWTTGEKQSYRSSIFGNFLLEKTSVIGPGIYLVAPSECVHDPWAAKEGAVARSHFKLYTMGTDQVKI